MPSSNKVRPSTSQALTEDGEAPSFVVTQLQPSTAQLSLENPVLLTQEFDYVPLFPFEPSEQGRNKEMKRNHCASLCQCLIDAVLRHNGGDVRQRFVIVPAPLA